MTKHARLLVKLELALPIEDYRQALAPPARGCGGFVLDSRTSEGDFTLLGAEPFLAFRAFRSARRLASGALGARVVVETRDGIEHAEVDDAFACLGTLLHEHAVARDASPSPLPFLGGAVGYIGYEAGQMLERLPCRRRPGIGLPDIAFFFHDWVLGRAHRTGDTWLSVIGRGVTDEDAASDAERTRERIGRVLASFERKHVALCRERTAPDVSAPASALLAASGARTVTARATYLDDIRAAKDRIFDGDAFEICLTHRLDAPFSGDPFELWRELRRRSPGPHATFLDLAEGAIVSSSPERFLSLDAERVASSRPIKGTRRRGATDAEDDQLAEDLATSKKDRAENAMIVDLVRNDLGRVCRFGSVETPELFAVERYATVHQLVSTVRGTLDDGHDRIDLVRACFPPGSMTGAPKIEAMTILENLEPTERGVYAGALGWFDFDAAMDLSVVIRSVLVKDGQAHVHVGGAIVADSDPEAEYEETLDKARAMLDALKAFSHSKSAIDTRARPRCERARVTTLIIDNYDSFTWNLVQLVGALGHTPRVFRNDAIDLDGVRNLRPSRVIFSPGPGHPAERTRVGVCRDILRELDREVPILGVCLGHQLIVLTYGGAIVHANELMHGKTSDVHHDGDGILAGLPRPFEAMRYHSLVADPASIPSCLDVTARCSDGTVMAVAHRERPVFGVQFHPESIGTNSGRALVANFLGEAP